MFRLFHCSSVSSNKSDTKDSTSLPDTDLSIIKIEETGDTGGLDMFVDIPEDRGVMGRTDGEDGDETGEIEESGDWGKEEFSNEGSNFSMEQGASWQGDGSFGKGRYKF